MSFPSPGTTKVYPPTPPQRGSFPLDHYAECRANMLSYLQCIKGAKGVNDLCREEAKAYLGCRMQHGLMKEEEWKVLGFTEAEVRSNSAATREGG